LIHPNLYSSITSESLSDDKRTTSFNKLINFKVVEQKVALHGVSIQIMYVFHSKEFFYWLTPHKQPNMYHSKHFSNIYLQQMRQQLIESQELQNICISSKGNWGVFHNLQLNLKGDATEWR